MRAMAIGYERPTSVSKATPPPMIGVAMKAMRNTPVTST